MRGRPKKTYLVDGKQMTEREGIKMIKRNMKSKAVDSYPQRLKVARAQGQLNGFHSIYK